MEINTLLSFIYLITILKINNIYKNLHNIYIYILYNIKIKLQQWIKCTTCITVRI